MSDFPRTVTPASVTELELPGPLITVSQSGKITKRATQHMGHRWSESYILNMQLTAHKGFLAAVRNLWRNGIDFDIAHVDYAVLKGTGGGSPIVQAATQLVALPETLSGWTVDNTPVLTAGQTDPFGGTAAYLLQDNDGASIESIYTPVTFTADGEKCVAIFLRQGSSAGNWLRVWDNSAGVVQRHRIAVTWAGGVPTLATSAGSGTRYTPEDYGGGWFRVPFTAVGVVAANNNFFQVGPTDFTAASTGTVYVFGGNAWNEVSPARHSGPSQPNNDAVGNILHVNGGTASVSNWLRAGDPVSVTINSTPVMLEATADVNTQANGYAPIPINPPLYTGSTPADNSAVITTTKMRACIIAPPQFPDSSGTSNDYGTLTLQFAEVV